MHFTLHRPVASFALLIAAALGLEPASALAQNAEITRKLPANKLDVTLPTAEKPALPVASLGLKHNEVLRTFDVAVQSDDEKPMQVFGVQTTAGLFVVDYPKVLTPKSKSTVTLIYVAKQNSSGSTDLLTLLTDRGEKTVQINHGREQAAAFDQTVLQWQTGDSAASKSIVINMLPGTSVPKAVKVLGAGATAALEPLGNDRYRVSVTPLSTAKAQQFPVVVHFVPALPGASTLIDCAVVSKP